MPLIIFVLILSILIMVHEWGHYITARRCGVKVEQFALGFGPKLWSRMHKGTEFCLCAIPLGGFVKMAGDERSQCTGNSYEFFSQAPGRRALIVLMGPVINLLLAYVCFWFVFMIGYPDMDLSTQNLAPVIGQVLPNSPAEQAGLKPGDKILAVGKQPVQHWLQLQQDVSSSKTSILALSVERDHQIKTIEVHPRQESQTDIFGRAHSVQLIGVGPQPISKAKDVVVQRYGFFGSLVKAGQELWNITAKTYEAIYQMAIGERSPKEAMGIVGMFFVIKFALSVGFGFLLHIVGIISASLAIFNLLPIIPLDGGHLFLLGLEKVRGRALSARVDEVFAKAGFSFIIILAVFVFYSDFDRIGLIDKMIKLFKGTGL